jgi:hypothetical protein
LQCAEAERQQRGALPVGEVAEVADADEAAWHQMQKKASQELIHWQAHDAFSVAMR